MSQPADSPELADSGDDTALNLLLNRPESSVPKDEPAPEPEEEQDETPADSDPDGDGEGEPAAGDDDPEVEWEAGGKKFKVKASELRNGYMKDSDYRQKTAEVAEQRRQIEALTQHYAQERQNAANQLDVFLGALQKELIGSQPDPQLIDSDPQEFLRQQAAYQQRASQFQAALQHRQSLQSRIDTDAQRKQQEYASHEAEKLLDRVPEWRNEAKRSKESGEIAEYLTTLGYSSEELAQLVDHRALLVARDAARYRALQAAKAKQSAPQITKTVKPGAARPETNNKDARYQEALAKARRSGRPEDIERVLMLKGS